MNAVRIIVYLFSLRYFILCWRNQTQLSAEPEVRRSTRQCHHPIIREKANTVLRYSDGVMSLPD